MLIGCVQTLDLSFNQISDVGANALETAVDCNDGPAVSILLTGLCSPQCPLSSSSVLQATGQNPRRQNTQTPKLCHL